MTTTTDWPELDDCNFGLPHLKVVPKPTVGEFGPIVSSCAVCWKSLHLHEITVMSDGEHICLNDGCETVYRNPNLGERVVTVL